MQFTDSSLGLTMIEFDRRCVDESVKITPGCGIAGSVTARLIPDGALPLEPVQDHLAGLSGLHQLERLIKIRDVKVVRDNRADVEATL